MKRVAFTSVLFLIGWTFFRSAAAADREPVASLKAILNRVQSEGTKPRVTDFMGPGKWEKRHFIAVGIEYDVRKTDSLVSPFVAHVTWKEAAYYSPEFKTRKDAEAASLPTKPNAGPDGAMICWATLAFQDGKWVTKDVGFDVDSEYFRNEPLFHQRYSTVDDVRRPLVDWWLAFGGVPPKNLAARELAASRAAAEAARDARKAKELAAARAAKEAAREETAEEEPASDRQWTSKEGKRLIVARFVGIKDGVAALSQEWLDQKRHQHRRIWEISINRLSDKDKRYIREHGKKRLETDSVQQRRG